MLAMKGPDQLLESRPRERPGAELTRQLEALMLVAKVGGAFERLKLARHLLATKWNQPDYLMVAQHLVVGPAFQRGPLF